MNELKFVYGPVPSRRMGESLGISPIPKKTCNYSCIYCQLGRTNKLSNERMEFFAVSDIINELKTYLKHGVQFDVITLVGEGEPALYLKIGDLISQIKELTSKPVAVITNGSLLYDKSVQNELSKADIVLPSLDAYDDNTFKKINRPHGKLNFMRCYITQCIKASYGFNYPKREGVLLEKVLSILQMPVVIGSYEMLNSEFRRMINYGKTKKVEKSLHIAPN